ncbi:hypothetical protein [Jannaschia sp. R86511]|uniref:hypothetical protein n=1 Tax=Jannaschia sp. R86511 TaxID=3093853 RepID=UPI0036D2A686
MSHGQAHVVQDASGTGPVAPLRLRHLLLVALVVGSCAVVYGSTVLASWSANGFDVLPLSQPGVGASGRPGPPVLPSEGSVLLGYLAILLTPFACVVGALLVGADVVVALGPGRPWRDTLPSLLVLVLCLAVLAAYVALGPLTSWWLD